MRFDKRGNEYFYYKLGEFSDEEEMRGTLVMIGEYWRFNARADIYYTVEELLAVAAQLSELNKHGVKP